ncbi:MAG TPA: alpha/beta hydrolase [Rubricoccaceae bacterium]|nr:alpha/beta hydrolase [Rubricoccaceae bacterium]
MARAVLPLALLLLAGCAGSRPPGSVETGYVEVDGGRLYYEAAGEGPAVVLVHGGFGDRRMWDAQFASLARSFRVVRYDHRGFGRSTPPDSVYSPAADLARLLDRLGIAQAHLVGNSVGGAFALEFALVHPARVGKLVVVASGANGYPYTEADVGDVRAVFAAAQAEGTARAAEMWLAHPMVAVTSRDPRTAPLLRAMVEENQAIFLLPHWPEEPLDPPAYERVGEIRAPVLFVIGEEDTPVVQRVAEATAERMPGARVERMPGADHLPQMVDPEGFDRLVRAFLQAP